MRSGFQVPRLPSLTVGTQRMSDPRQIHADLPELQLATASCSTDRSGEVGAALDDEPEALATVLSLFETGAVVVDHWARGCT